MKKGNITVFMVFEKEKTIWFGDHKRIFLSSVNPHNDGKYTLIPLRVPFDMIEDVWQTDTMIPTCGSSPFNQIFVSFKNGERFEILGCNLYYAKVTLRQEEEISIEDRVLALEEAFNNHISREHKIHVERKKCLTNL